MILILLLLGFGFALNPSLINLQSYQLIDYMKRIEDFPTFVYGRQVREWILHDRLPDGRFFIEDRVFTEEDLRSFLEETNTESLNELVLTGYGWTLRRASMRMYPSNATVHRGNPRIDYNQYTLLEPFTPLAILHKSKSGQWLYVHAPFMRGWVRKEDVFISNREELIRVLRLPFLVVTADRVRVQRVEFGLGSKIPYIEKSSRGYRVLLPDGTTQWLEKLPGLNEGYRSFEEEKVRSILQSMLGTTYDWGGKEGRWDCSSLVQGLFGVFGVELPRNSAQQARIGRVVAGGFRSYEEMKETLRRLPPFRTLLFMKGHVIIYGGMEGDDIVIYHSVHRLTREDGTRVHINAITKNYLEREGFRNLYSSIISVNVLD